MINLRSISKYLLPSTLIFAYLFLYTPILLIMLFSFNDDPLAYSWTGFTTKWYGQLWGSSELWGALQTSFIVALSTVFFSVSMSVFLVCYGMQKIVPRLIFMFYGNLAIPEIVLSVGLLSFFSFFSVKLGLVSLIIAHTLLGLGYVVPIVYARYSSLDKRLLEAAYDLGATEQQAFRTIVLPLLAPALATGGLLIFIISFDDFLLSLFCSSGSAQTLPIYIFSLIRMGASPSVNALSTLLLLFGSSIMGLFFWINIKKMDDL
jgi:spermidine/putrescine transport system permease protein